MQLKTDKINVKDLAGITVIYNPRKNVIENINTYINEINKLYLIDNSEKSNDAISSYFQGNSKVEYVFNKGNLGIAKAQNIGAEKAISAGYSFLLTMDQDSGVTPGMIAKLLYVFEEYKNIGLVSPVHANKFNIPKTSNRRFDEVLNAKSSGNIISLDAYKNVGTFNEEYFIDYVDIEYCMRLKASGYKVIQVNDAILIHNEADMSKRKFFFKFVYPYNHNPIRFYYISRNRFYLRDKFKTVFPEYFKKEIKSFINIFIKVFLYENHKILKFKMSFYGYRDYKEGKTGKINSNYL